MRLIKFRGKRVDSGEWVYGDLIAGQYIFPCDSLTVDMGSYYSLNMIEVLPETVGQFTGLKDKNGVEIYEGDINEDKGVVIFNQDDASFCWDYKDVEVMPMGDEFKWCKVIGNIHENPELLT